MGNVATRASLPCHALCDVTIQLEARAPVAVGKSPWRNRHISYISAGVFEGERLRGTVSPGGADWSEAGRGPEGSQVVAVDVRSSWRTHDGAELYVTYTGRIVIPAAVLPEFAKPTTVESIDPESYYFRTLLTIETGDPRYTWLNEIVAIGFGQRTEHGVRYKIYSID